MRDFLAYKEFQKEIDKERALKDKDDYNNAIADNTRKLDEKSRRRRRYYEDFAH